MTKGADFFKTKKCTKQEADMRLAIYNARPNASPTYLVNIGILYSQASELLKADTIFANYIRLAPDSIYGYDWKGRVNFTLDTTMTIEPYASQFVSNYQKTLEIALTDKSRYKSQGTRAALFLAGYFNNVKSSRDSAFMYVVKGLEVDSTNMQLKNIKEIFDKQPTKGTKPPAKAAGGKPASSIRKPSNRT